MKSELTVVEDLLAGLLEYANGSLCRHQETTHRAGAIWTVCDSCGAKWADDEGGMPKFTLPQPILTAQRYFVEKAKPESRNDRIMQAAEELGWKFEKVPSPTGCGVHWRVMSPTTGSKSVSGISTCSKDQVVALILRSQRPDLHGN